MSGTNAQREALDALRKLDNLLIAELDEVGRVRDQAGRFRNTLFEAMAWIEEQCFQLKVLQIKTKREESNLLRVEIRERLPIVLYLDPEPAVDSEIAGSQGAALVARLSVLMAPPVPGLLRQYTIDQSGSWRRATFVRSRGNTLSAKTVAAPAFTSEMLLLEAVDMLGYISTLRFGWPDPTSRANALTLDEVRDRTRNRDAAVSL